METTANYDPRSHIRQALNLLEGPAGDGGRWTQHAMALDSEGKHVHFLDDRAERFCLRGALWRVASLGREIPPGFSSVQDRACWEVNQASNLIQKESGVRYGQEDEAYYGIMTINDTFTWAELRALLQEVSSKQRGGR